MAQPVDSPGDPLARTIEDTHSSTTVGEVAIAGAPADRLEVVPPGRYQMGEEHARGGMGAIWRAVDRRLGRTVAIKQLQRNSRGAEARFIREAMITARLEHPGIVPVHDAGRQPDGEPYYAMKLVAGRSLAELIEERPGLSERLALLPHALAVADAIAYAHHHGVIHRDLKPANVVIGDYGETVVVDWGLAKELGHPDDQPGDSGSPAHATAAGAWLGTPGYMAPEQARGQDVDRRADVYALGALVYHLLAGVRPYHGVSGEEAVAHCRQSPPADLADLVPDVPHELAAIVRAAMARDPDDRYADAAGFRDDLRRFQTGQLVRAHHYSAIEHVRRWARRRRAALAIVAVVACAGAAVYGLARRQASGPSCEVAEGELAGAWDDAVRTQLTRAFAGAELARARVEAGLDQRAAAWRARRQAVCEATHERGVQSQATLELRMRCLDRRRDELAALTRALSSMTDADPRETASRAVAALPPLDACDDVDALAAAVPLPAEPARRARLAGLEPRVDDAIATRQVGRYAQARQQLEALRAEVEDLAYAPLMARHALARARALEDLGDYAGARAGLVQAVHSAASARDDAAVARAWIAMLVLAADLQRDLDGADALEPVAHAAVLRAGDVMLAAELDQARGVIRWRRGDYAGARADYQRALAQFKAHLPPDSDSLAQLYNDLGIVSRRLGDAVGARGYYQEALRIYEANYGVDNPRNLSVMHNLAMVAEDDGQFAVARDLLERTLEVKTRSLGPRHADTGNTHQALADVVRKQGDLDGARTHFEAALDIALEALGPDHARVGNAVEGLAAVAADTGDLLGAETLYRRALAVRQSALGADHPVTGGAHLDLGRTLLARGDARGARAACQRGLAILEAALGADHIDTGRGLVCVGRALAALGQRDGARAQLARASAIFAATGNAPARAEVDRWLNELDAADHRRGRGMR